ncbi:hypothetical protein Ancab_010516 [Ancistrocladus abbreviatus]
MNNKSSDVNKTMNDGGCTKQATLKTVLAETLGYGPQLSEHLILDAGLALRAKISAVTNGTMINFRIWPKLLQNLDEYCPILLNQFKCRDFIKFDRFDASLDEFYSKIEGHVFVSSMLVKSLQLRCFKRVGLNEGADDGLQMVRCGAGGWWGYMVNVTALLNCKPTLEEENCVHALGREVEHSIRMAQLIEYNLEDVAAAILAVRVALVNGNPTTGDRRVMALSLCEGTSNVSATPSACPSVGLTSYCPHSFSLNLSKSPEKSASDNATEEEEDDIHEIGEEEKGKLNDVDYLTAAKTAMNLFTPMPAATNRKKELMKACTDPKLVAAIIGDVKITAAGLTQLKQKQKRKASLASLGADSEEL